MIRLLAFLFVVLLAVPAVAQTSVGCAAQPVGAIPFSRMPKLRNDADCGVVALTDAATIATNVGVGNIFSVMLAGNRTLANPTGVRAGGHYDWLISQDATGSRTLTYGSFFRFPGGAPGTLSTAANATDRVSCLAQDPTHLRCTITLGYDVIPTTPSISLADVAVTTDGLAFSLSGPGIFSFALSDGAVTADSVAMSIAGTCSFSLDFSQACNTVYAAAAL